MPRPLPSLLALLTGAAVLAVLLLLDEDGPTRGPSPLPDPAPLATGDAPPTSPALAPPTPATPLDDRLVAAPAAPAAEPLAAATDRVPVTGEVVDEAGRPVAGARIHTSWEPAGSHSQRVRVVHADADGRFSVGVLELGSLRLRADAPGTLGWVSERLAVGVDGQPLHVRITLEAGCSLDVLVLDTTGLPLASQEIVARLGGDQPHWLARSYRTSSDRDGRASLRGLEPGHWSLTAVGQTLELELAAGEHRELTLVAPPPPVVLPVAGVVLCGSEPVADAHVTLLVTDEDGVHRVQASERSDAEGRFAFEVLEEHGAVRVAVWTEESAGDRSSESPELHPPQTDVHLQLAASRLTVRAVDPAGRVAPDREIGLHVPGLSQPWRSRRSDEQGLARFGWVPAGDWELRERHHPSGPGVHASSHPFSDDTAQRVTLEAGAHRDDLLLIVRDLGRLSGRIDTPRGQVVVHLWPEGRRSATVLVACDAHGAFTVEHLPPGPWQIRAHTSLKPDFATDEASARRVVIEPGRTTEVVLEAPTP